MDVPSSPQSERNSGTSSPDDDQVTVGARIMVLRKENNEQDAYGIVRFKGSADFAKGVWLGVELDEAGTRFGISRSSYFISSR